MIYNVVIRNNQPKIWILIIIIIINILKCLFVRYCYLIKVLNKNTFIFVRYLIEVMAFQCSKSKSFDGTLSETLQTFINKTRKIKKSLSYSVAVNILNERTWFHHQYPEIE